MRITKILYAQHIGWHFKKHWLVQGRRVPRDTGAAAQLLKFGIQVKTPDNLFNPPRDLKKVDIVGATITPIPEDQSHPNWHTTPCSIYKDSNVLIGGLPQAQVLTNTIEVKNFPSPIEDSIINGGISKNVDRSVQNAIFFSQLLDAQQNKLPKVKPVERPAFNLPRIYGITHERRNRLLINNLLREIEKLSGRSVAINRKFVDNVTFQTSVTKDQSLLIFLLNGDKFITSARALDAIKGKHNGELPDLYPMKYTVSMQKQHIYSENDLFPIRSDIRCSHPHTIISFFDKNVVKNIHGSEVTSSQFYGRTLLKAFVAAVARAKQLYCTSSNGDLPKPIVVQSVQTNGKEFHFGIFQLNTLNLNSNSSTKNYWFHRQSSELFTECGYKNGRPYLEGYNCEAFYILKAFYNNN